MTDESGERSRTAAPLIIAASIALLFVAVAVITNAVRARLSPQKQAAVAACEAAYGTSRPAIVGGDVFDDAESQGLADTLDRLGYAPGKPSEAPMAPGAVAIVWQLDDGSHALCTVVPGAEPVVGPLSSRPSPTPSPSASAS